MEPESYVLDAFALLALIRHEPAEPQVRELLERGLRREAILSMSIVNWGEVAYEIERRNGVDELSRVVALIDAAPIELVDAGRDVATRAASFKVRGRVSYADCFALALAQALNARVVTGDPEFRQFENEVRIEWLPQRPQT